MAKDHGPSIKDDERYEALRQEGMSKEKAARIANTPRTRWMTGVALGHTRTGPRKSCWTRQETLG